MFVSSTHRFSIPPFTRPWENEQGKGDCTITFNPKDVSQALAKITQNGEKGYGTVKWKSPILSKEKLRSLLVESPQTFEIKVKRKGVNFKVYIYSQKMSDEANDTYQKLNSEIFTYNTNRLNLTVDWCNEKQDKGARQQFLLDLIFNSSLNTKNEIGASNAITILRSADYSFSSLPFENIRTPFANLSGGIFVDTNLKNSHLKHVKLENACLIGAKLIGADLEGMEMGRWPNLIHEGQVVGFVLSSEDRLLASWTTQGELYLWDLKNCLLLHKIDQNRMKQEKLSPVTAQSFYNQEDIFLIGHLNGWVSLWTLTPLRLIENFQAHQGQVLSLLLSPNCEYLVTRSREELCLWKIEIDISKNSQAYLKVREQVRIKSAWPKDNRERMCFSTRSKLLAHVTKEEDYKLLIWSTDGQQIACWEDINFVHYLKFSNDDQWLIGVQGPKFCKWRVQKTQPQGELLFEEEEAVNHFHLSPDESLFFYTCGEMKPSICIRHGSNYKEICRVPVYSIIKMVPSYLTHSLLMVDLTYNRILIQQIDSIINQGHTIRQGVTGYYNSNNQLMLVQLSLPELMTKPRLADCIYTRYLANMGKIISQKKLTLSGLIPKLLQQSHASHLFRSTHVDMIRFISPNNRHVVFWFHLKGSPNKCFSIWDLENDIDYWTFEIPAKAYALTKDGRHVAFLMKSATGNPQTNIEIWDTYLKKSILTIPFQEKQTNLTYKLETDLTWASKGYLALHGGFDIDLWVIEAKELNCFFAPLPRITCSQKIKTIKFAKTQEGQPLLIASMGTEGARSGEEGIIRIWDLEYQKELLSFNFQKDMISSFDVSPQSSLLVSASGDGLHHFWLRLWDLKTGSELQKVQMDCFLTDVQFSPNGQFIVAYDENDGRLYSWEVCGEQIRFLWNRPKGLMCQRADFTNAKNLSPLNKTLLKQLEAIVE